MSMIRRRTKEGIVEPAQKAYSSAVFMENDVKQIEEVQKFSSNGLTIIQIPESPIEELGAEIRSLALKIRVPDENSYVKIRYLKAKYIGKEAHERFDAKSGFDLPQLEQLKEWLNNTKFEKHRAAIFDWDRTLTKFEGVSLVEMDLGNFKKKDKITPFYTPEQVREDSLIFLMGGTERLQRIRGVLKMLSDRKVDIIILTNNANCPDAESLTLFRRLVQHLMGANINFRIISALAYEGNKGLALEQTILSHLCTKPKRDKSPVRQ